MSYPFYYGCHVSSYPPRLYAHEPSMSSNSDSEVFPEYGTMMPLGGPSSQSGYGTISLNFDQPASDSIDDVANAESPSRFIPLPSHSETEGYLRRTLGIPEPHRVNLWAFPNGRKLKISEMIRLAIWGSPEKKLTQAKICEAIEERYPHMRGTEDQPWRRSVRHNLSLMNIFERIDRPQDHPGKGGFWVLNVRHGETTRKNKKPGGHGDEGSMSPSPSSVSSPLEGFFPSDSYAESPGQVPLNSEELAMLERFQRQQLDRQRHSPLGQSGSVPWNPQPIHSNTFNPLMTFGNHSFDSLGPSIQPLMRRGDMPIMNPGNPRSASQPSLQVPEAGPSRRRQNPPLPERRRTYSTSFGSDDEEGNARGIPKVRRGTGSQ